MSKLVSIILPVYNGERFLKESIDSVINQTYTNWELLILDDCSTDSTSVISKEYAKKDSRISYYRNETNLKLPNNLNKGFSLAKGEYLTWTSDDNKYRPTAIERMAKILDKGTAQLVYASCRIINEEGAEIEYIMCDKDTSRRLKGKDSIGACFLYTREVYECIGDYDSNCILVEDLDYWQRVAASFQLDYIRDILYDYRFHNGALTSTMKKELFYNNLKKVILKNRKLYDKLDFFEKYYFYKSLYICEQNLSSGNHYGFVYFFYSVIYFFCFRVPNKIKRLCNPFNCF